MRTVVYSDYDESIVVLYRNFGMITGFCQLHRVEQLDRVQFGVILFVITRDQKKRNKKFLVHKLSFRSFQFCVTAAPSKNTMNTSTHFFFRK